MLKENNFLVENCKKINKTVFMIIALMNLVPTLFLILSSIGIFSIPLPQCVLLLALTVSFTFLDAVLIRYEKSQIPAIYVGLMSINLMICYIGCNPNIQVYIVFALCPIISCLYYDTKLTKWITIITYLIMVFSFYMKSFGIVAILNYKGRTEPLSWFIPEIIGVSMQYLFVCLVAYILTRHTQESLNNIIEANNKTENVLASLQEKNIEISTYVSELDEKNKELEDTQYKIIKFVAECLGSHDLFTGRHVIHTQKYVEIISKELKKQGCYVEELTYENIKLFTTAAFLHDIGKIHIPEGILNKVGKFTEDEFEKMKSHPTEGKKLLSFLPPINDGKFNMIATEMAYCHHEKWDGTGYPQRLSGTDIPLSARIMAAADVLDALISRRLYKDLMSLDEAMKIFKESKGTHFEPCIVDAVLACKEQIAEIDAGFKRTETDSNEAEFEWWQRYHSTARN